MDVSHGIGVTNRFDIFCNEDADPYEILRQQDEEKQKRKIEKTQMKEKSKTTKAVTAASPKKPTENSTAKSKDVGEVPNRPRGLKTSDRPPRSTGSYQDKETEKNSRNRNDHFFNPDQREGEYRRGRGGYRGRGGRDRGRGFFPNAEGRPRRVFDRHSGSDKTGVRSVDKRDGAGPNNWGDIRSEMNQRNTENTWDEEFESGGDKPRDSANWGEEDPNESGKFGNDIQKGENNNALDSSELKENDQNEDEQVQEAVKEMTLDEYKKEIEAQKTVHKFNIRKPGEGEDQKKWKKGYVLKKKVPIEDEEQDDDDDIEEEDNGRKGQKVLLDIQFNFYDSRRGMRGRGRGGRGGSRGGAGRDGGNRDFAKEDRSRGGRGRDVAKNKSGQQAAPRVDDFNDFPSLNNA
ncbi:plasminogen activator inhibitor 1 RNA-binding protein [Nephila pilipes]|uniref:Plasminogen activator inhibitor 1 RNA-binding protein n=1 Tax=Nephila pilipes TaxID=299642 RepID=A0A8X6PZ97_NEPPI|nr:plasminogen activator inhibitor 1 RNA-binding protein [Nephila pilipes]